MTPAQEQRAEELFLEAVELPRAERGRYLDQHCGDDRALRMEVETLLAHDGGAEFLESESRVGGVRPSDLLKQVVLGDEPNPESVHGYRILRKIGQGGTASVYEAEQDSPRRTVAVKIVHSGPGNRGLQRRFQREIQILGQLTHPGIAQIFGAGIATTPRGELPYFAMELVHGEPLTEFANRRKLDTRARLTLIADVCDAVQFAHEKGIIHRDLKPANILVEERNGDARVKVLDFGVARAIAPDVQLTIEHTNVAQIIGTIPYMSPEQVSGKTSDLDPRTDVYSLGVVLYELLGDRLPLDVSDRSIAEAARIIQETEPTRLSSIHTVLRGDIETIVAKSMEKDRGRRYQSAAELATDIRRFLRDETIQARPASTFYQLRKFAKRNRGLVASLAVLLVGLIAATAISTRFAFSEAAQRRIADRRAHRANIVAANAEIAAGDPIRARNFLEQASVDDRRTWEWKYLAARLNTADSALRGHSGPVNSIAFSPDGTQLASASDDQSLRLWDPLTGVELSILLGHEGSVERVAFVGTGGRIISGGSDGTLRVWDAVAGAPLTVLDTGGFIVDLAVSEDGAAAVAIVDPKRLSGPDPEAYRRVQIWNLNNYEIERQWRVSIGLDTYSCRFSQDGSEVLLGMGTGIERRDTCTGARILIHNGAHDFPPVQLASDACGATLATCARDKSIAIWNPATFEILHHLQGHQGPVRSVAFTPEGDRLASGADDQTVRIWDAPTGQLSHTLLAPGGAVHSVCFSPDGRWLAAASSDAMIHLWGLARVESGLTAGVLRGHTGAVYDVAFRPGTNTVVSASWSDHSLRFWNSATGALIRAASSLPNQIQHIACSPNGHWVAVGSYSLDIIDADSCEVVRIGQVGDRTRSLVFTADGKRVVTTATRNKRRGVVRTWDIVGAARVAEREFEGDVLAVECRTGIRLAVMDRGAARLLDFETEKQLLSFAPGNGRIERLRFAPDGSRFLTACDDGTVGLFDASTGGQLALLRGHTEKVYDAIFSPDGTRIATASNDNTIRIWRADTYEEVLDLRGHERYVYALAFSPDGTELVSASGDGTVRLWNAR